MPVHIDLRRLADLNAPDRSFVSLYLTGAKALDNLERRIRTTRKLLVNNDEHTYFDENMALIERHLQDHPPTGSLALFACWALDLIEAYPLEVPLTEDLLWVDSSPYIRPLAELQDEYENFAVIVADNTEASVHLVTSLQRTDNVRISGNVKNHVKVGGWSQQRYQRRREKQLKHYADDVVTALRELKRQHAFRRILMVGSRETLAEIRRVMPRDLEDLVFADRSIDLSKGDHWIQREVFDLFQEAERASELDLWSKIRDAYFRGGRAAVAVWDVLWAVRHGQVEAMVVQRDLQVEGIRCRSCEHLGIGYVDTCQACGSKDIFKVDLVNEIVELLMQTGATVDFVDAPDDLLDLGGIAALLRY